MYKTVRHGENSLQYTILPQTEEVLINSGVKGKGRDYSPTNQPSKSSRKEIIVNYLLICLLALFLLSGLVFSLLAFIGVIPIDGLSSNNKTCHDSWLGQSSRYTAANLTAHSVTVKKDTSTQTGNSTENPIITSTQHPNDLQTATTDFNNQINVDVKSTVMTTPSEPSTNSVSKWDQIAPTKVKNVVPSGTIYPLDPTDYSKMITITATVDKTTFYPPHQRQSNNDLMLKHEWTDYEDDDDEDDYDLTKLTSTVSSKTNEPTSLLIQDSVVDSATQIISTPPPPAITGTTKIIQATANPNNQVTDVDEDMDKNRVKSKMDAVKFRETKERILDDDDEDDEYKEPLTDEDDVSEQTKSDDVKIKAQPKSWLQIRWPFVDPSSYFQWTGYSARDNLLLPAILSAALSALLVLAVLCYALRRRQRCKRRIQEIGNLTSDLQAEDNANLLAAADNSSEDE